MNEQRERMKILAYWCVVFAICGFFHYCDGYNNVINKFEDNEIRGR